MTADEYEPRTVEEAFAEQRLPMPPIPKRFAPDIQQREKWLWSTSPQFNSFEMYMFPLPDSLASPMSDYWGASFAGHGVNSYSMNLFVVYGCLALFLQEGWDGVYMDADKQRLLIANEFTLCSRLLAQSEHLMKAGRESGTRRLVVAASGFRDNALGWLDAPLADPGVALEWFYGRAAGPRMAEGGLDAAATLRQASEMLDSAGATGA